MPHRAQCPAGGLTTSAHPRTFRGNWYVYPVLSRRSDGISVGINLQPAKRCSFGCLYCQVDRRRALSRCRVRLPVLLAELRAVLAGLRPGGRLWSEPEFATLPPAQRHVTDVAFSGDGEPTLYRDFERVVRQVVRVKDALDFGTAKTVLITNASGLARHQVRRALRLLDRHHGEVWAKLDAGTAAHFRTINRASVSFEHILRNILACAREREVVIQSCFVRLHGQGPSRAELDAYLARLRELRAAGARIRLVQVLTVARPPAYGIVSSLPDREVERIAKLVRTEAGLPAQAFFGAVPPGRGIMGRAP